jgi:recombination protein RecR
MSTIDKLVRIFTQFPGIGVRQARRFVYFLLQSDQKVIDELTTVISSLKKAIRQCEVCCSFFENNLNVMDDKICPRCIDSKCDKSLILILERDSDLEKACKIYSGQCFVLGGTLPLTENSFGNLALNTKKLLTIVENRIKEGVLKEVILAFSATPEGDHTAFSVIDILTPLCKEYSIKITRLGRGLSTGAELEYSDEETLRAALENRK